MLGVRLLTVPLLLTLLGACAEPPPPVAPDRAELDRARWVAWERDRTIAALEAKNRALEARLATAGRVDRSEEITSRLDDLARSQAQLAAGLAELRHRAAAPGIEPAAADVTLVSPGHLDPASSEELRRLRAQLLDAGFGKVTLTSGQMRALLRALKPVRPIDEHSPFTL